MKFRRLLYISLLTFAVIACKKDDDDTILPLLDGSLKITGIQSYIGTGETLTMKPEGLSHPDGKIIGYYWKISKIMDSNDTTRYANGLDKNGVESDGSFQHTFPSSTDSLDTYTVHCYAFAKGYSGQSATGYVTVVKGGSDGSIKGIPYPQEFISTENADYYYRTIGTQTWTINNIAETPYGLPYGKLAIMSDIYGRYYSHEEATAVCENLPGGEWKLPSMDDWAILDSYISGQTESDPAYGKSTAAALMADATFNGVTMWEYWPEVGDITNSSGFSAIPTGYSNIESGSFTGMYRYAAFWTSTLSEGDSDMAYCKYMMDNSPEIYTGEVDRKSFGASVRCIRK